MIKRLSLICGLILSFAGVLGLVYTLDGRWAKADEVKSIAQRLDEKIASDRSDRLQERIWRIEDRFKSKEMPVAALQEYRDLKKEFEAIQLQLKKVVK